MSNYCVEQAGFHGTDSKVALSWEKWDQPADGDPKRGDIVVFRRRNQDTDADVGGHVGFFFDHDEATNTILVLGGNQGQRVSKKPFPRDGRAYGFHYQLVSIRRA